MIPLIARLLAAVSTVTRHRVRCARSQRNPSTISLHTEPRRRAVPGVMAGGGLRASTSRAAAAKVTASRANGRAGATANRTPAAGAPRKPPATADPAWSRPFARGSASGGTNAGSSANEAESKRVPRVASRNAATSSTRTPTRLSATTTASAATTAARTPSTTAIVRRRSQRSAYTPPSRPKSSGGNCPATVTAAMIRGSRVTVAASRASAGVRSASPNRDETAADHRSWKSRPRAEEVMPATVPVRPGRGSSRRAEGDRACR
ncbi:hypothetical protein PSN01_01589 [Micromonospora saelicesensis]|nr:hypothetical protein PSN01_01589 [Micromonospora saelicesensis]